MFSPYGTDLDNPSTVDLLSSRSNLNHLAVSHKAELTWIKSGACRSRLRSLETGPTTFDSDLEAFLAIDSMIDLTTGRSSRSTRSSVEVGGMIPFYIKDCDGDKRTNPTTRPPD
jgi:hypothetical protein